MACHSRIPPRIAPADGPDMLLTGFVFCAVAVKRRFEPFLLSFLRFLMITCLLALCCDTWWCQLEQLHQVGNCSKPRNAPIQQAQDLDLRPRLSSEPDLELLGPNRA